MKLQFANEFNEYASGNFHVVNDGKPFDAIGDLAVELLKAKAALPTGEVVDVFEPAGPEEVEESTSTQEEPPEGGTHSASEETASEEAEEVAEPKKRRK